MIRTLLHSGAASFDGEVLHDLGHIVEGLDSTDIAEIPSNVVVENIHVFAEAALRPEEAVAIVEKTESARKRRAIGKQREGPSPLRYQKSLHLKKVNVKLNVTTEWNLRLYVAGA